MFVFDSDHETSLTSEDDDTEIQQLNEMNLLKFELMDLISNCTSIKTLQTIKSLLNDPQFNYENVQIETNIQDQEASSTSSTISKTLQFLSENLDEIKPIFKKRELDVSVKNKNGCLVKERKTLKGYYSFSVTLHKNQGRHSWNLHQVAFAYHANRIPNPNLHVSHLCANPKCIEKSHLIEEPQQENLKRRGCPGNLYVECPKCERFSIRNCCNCFKEKPCLIYSKATISEASEKHAILWKCPCDEEFYIKLPTKVKAEHRDRLKNQPLEEMKSVYHEENSND